MLTCIRDAFRRPSVAIGRYPSCHILIGLLIVEKPIHVGDDEVFI